MTYNYCQIFPISHVKYDIGDLVNLVSDVGDLSQMNPDTILKLTDRVSHSMLDVSNLTKSAHLSLSTPSLVAGGVWSKLKRKKSKAADSKTHLLRSSDGLDNCGYVETESVSLSVEELDFVRESNILWAFLAMFCIQGCVLGIISII